MLLERGAAVNAYDNQEGWTALMFSAAEGHADCVRILLDHEADASMTDVDGESAADFARNNGHARVGALLK